MDYIPEPWNKAYVSNILVNGGTISATRYACAGCETVLSEPSANWIMRVAHLDAHIRTRFGNALGYGINPEQTYAYCDECYSTVSSILTGHAAELHERSDGYDAVTCGQCGMEGPLQSYTAYVVGPQEVRKQGRGRGMPAPRHVDGSKYAALCPGCRESFEDGWVTAVDEEETKAAARSASETHGPEQHADD